MIQWKRISLWKLVRHTVRVVLVALVVWILVVLGLSAAIVIVGDQENARPADAIIVLGSGLTRSGRAGDALTRRSVWAAHLYQEGIASAVICTGGVGQGQPRSEADACREVLVRQGVPAEAIHLEEQSRSTEENAIYAQEIMLAHDWHTAVIVTDSFHMLRANWIFGVYFDREGMSHYRSPAPREWVRAYHYRRHFVREIAALHWQAFKTIFNLPNTYVG